MKTITRLKVVVCLLMCAGFTPTIGSDTDQTGYSRRGPDKVSGII